MTSFNLIFTTPKISGVLVILASIVLSLITNDSVYFTAGVPSGSGLLTADTIGNRIVESRALKNKNDNE